MFHWQRRQESISGISSWWQRGQNMTNSDRLLSILCDFLRVRAFSEEGCTFLKQTVLLYIKKSQVLK